MSTPYLLWTATTSSGGETGIFFRAGSGHFAGSASSRAWSAGLVVVGPRPRAVIQPISFQGFPRGTSSLRIPLLRTYRRRIFLNPLFLLPDKRAVRFSHFFPRTQHHGRDWWYFPAIAPSLVQGDLEATSHTQRPVAAEHALVAPHGSPGPSSFLAQLPRPETSRHRGSDHYRCWTRDMARPIPTRERRAVCAFHIGTASRTQ